MMLTVAVYLSGLSTGILAGFLAHPALAGAIWPEEEEGPPRIPWFTAAERFPTRPPRPRPPRCRQPDPRVLLDTPGRRMQ